MQDTSKARRHAVSDPNPLATDIYHQDCKQLCTVNLKRNHVTEIKNQTIT